MTNKLVDYDCQGLCEFHGKLWCKEYNRPCREYIEALDCLQEVKESE